MVFLQASWLKPWDRTEPSVPFGSLSSGSAHWWGYGYTLGVAVGQYWWEGCPFSQVASLQWQLCTHLASPTSAQAMPMDSTYRRAEVGYLQPQPSQGSSYQWPLDQEITNELRFSFHKDFSLPSRLPPICPPHSSQVQITQIPEWS